MLGYFKTNFYMTFWHENVSGMCPVNVTIKLTMWQMYVAFVFVRTYVTQEQWLCVLVTVDIKQLFDNSLVTVITAYFHAQSFTARAERTSKISTDPLLLLADHLIIYKNLDGYCSSRKHNHFSIRLTIPMLMHCSCEMTSFTIFRCKSSHQE